MAPVEHEPEYLVERLAPCLVGPDAGDEFVEQHAERVDIRRRRDREPSALLRASIVRRQGADADRCRRGIGRESGVVEEPGDAEVEYLGHAVGRHEDVGRFDVSMNDAVPVRAMHGGAHATKQVQARRQGQRALAAVGGDGHAFDVFHREVRVAVGRQAGVDEPDDVRMAERGEDLTFGLETAGGRRIGHVRLGELEAGGLEVQTTTGRPFFVKLPVGAGGFSVTDLMWMKERWLRDLGRGDKGR